MISALSDEDSLPAFGEMLSNDAPFDHTVIGKAIIEHYTRHPRKHFYEQQKGETRVSVHLKQDFISIASTKFLIYIADACGGSRTKVTDTLLGYALAELQLRGYRLPKAVFQTILRTFRTDQFTFNVNRDGAWVPVVLAKLAPSERA